MDFIKNALREFKHVVWPTREETKKYFIVVLSVLCAFGLYLFLVGNIFSEILFGIKNVVNPSTPAAVTDIQLPEGLEGLEGLTITGSTNANPIIPDVTGEAVIEPTDIEITEEVVPAETEVIEETEEVQ